MKKLFFVTLVILGGLITGLETRASESNSPQKAMADDPCFWSTDSWAYCSANGIYIAGYPQEDGLYYYYSWQCASFSCPL